jgi:hypothetical protein
MPVLTLACPDCGHVFKGGVFPGAKPPEVWVCSQCLGRRAAPLATGAEEPHPFEGSHGGCRCCG